MQTYLNILEELKEETTKTKNRSWKWMLFWRKNETKYTTNPASDPEQETLIQQDGSNQLDSPSNKLVPELVMERRGSAWNAPCEETNVQQGLYRKILNVVRVLERDDGWFLTLNCPFISIIANV
jgi:hypothetical protein